jgi:hypothetical protein
MGEHLSPALPNREGEVGEIGEVGDIVFKFI